MEKFIRRIYDHFFDILNRKGDLRKKYLKIREIAKNKNFHQIEKCAFSDFVVLLMKIAPKS